LDEKPGLGFQGPGHPLVFLVDLVGDMPAEEAQEGLDLGELGVPFPGLDFE